MPAASASAIRPGSSARSHRQAVAVQFHRHAVAESFGQARQQAFGFRLLCPRQQPRERAAGAAGEQDQAGRVGGDRHRSGKLRLQAGIGVQEAARRQALEVGEAGRVLRQQHDRVGRQARIVGAGQRDLAADDRLDALGRAGLAEFQRAEQVGRYR